MKRTEFKKGGKGDEFPYVTSVPRWRTGALLELAVGDLPE